MKKCFIHDWRRKPNVSFSNANGTYCIIKCAQCGQEETREISKQAYVGDDVSKWPRWKERR